MAKPTRTDPYSVGNFRIEIASITVGSFRKCAGLKSETEVFELQEGGENEVTYKLVGPTKASNIVLTRGFIDGASLFDWRRKFISGEDRSRRNGSIIAMAADSNTDVGRWNFTKAWPVRWEMTDFDAMSGEAACEILELAVETISKVS